MAMEVATFGRALAAGTADIRRAPAATAAERGVGEWLGTTLSHSFDGQRRFVNFHARLPEPCAALRKSAAVRPAECAAGLEPRAPMVPM
ncbi:unnamed protein product [Stenotrophomonas maltophilia]|nr:unnamed protein product [Stenotrophomonas maltophilia]